jgi:uncharacterized protein
MLASLIADFSHVDLHCGELRSTQRWKTRLPESGIEILQHGTHICQYRNPSRRRARRYYRGVRAAVPVCVFAKPPIPGEVKTRLIGTLGKHGAAALASAMFRDVWAVVSSVSAARPILATDRCGDFPVLVAPEEMWLQGDGDLGERLERILIRALQSAPAALAVGADTPLIGRSELTEAIKLLEHFDSVIGPAEDGGFYLLGLTRCCPGLFAGLPWSSSKTAEAVKQRLEENKMTVHEIDLGFDVDTPSDLRRLTEELTRNPGSAPETRAWLNCNAPFHFQR